MRYLSASYRVPKGTHATHYMNPSHFAVPTARLYGWLPLSDAYGIGCAKGGYPYLMPMATAAQRVGNFSKKLGEVATSEADKVADKVSNKSAQKVLMLLYDNGHLTRDELSELTGLSLGGIKKIINSLRESGLIVRVGSNKTGYWKVINKEDE